MSKRFRFKIARDLDELAVTWLDKVTTDTLTLGIHDIADEHVERAQEFFTCYGLQKFCEDRTSGVDTEGKLAERKALWASVCEMGHTVKKVRVGGLFVVAAVIEAIAEIKGVPVSVIQIKRKEMDAETWNKIIANPKVIALAEEIQAKRDADDTDFSDLIEEAEAEEEEDTEA